VKKAIRITLARLTCQRVSDILDQLRKADEQVYMDGWAKLPGDWKRILKMRQDMRSHPTCGDVAYRLMGQYPGLTARGVRTRERLGLFHMFEAFELAGYKVAVDGILIERCIP
jgi:hypothetical protein